MNNTINTQSGERLSFFKLFSDKKYRVLIPIIQRDYAQGRATTKEIRNTFLDALHKYLVENKSNRDLDFVYGSLSNGNTLTDFIPLDGQQRLTTLFLLHWYLYQISNNTEKKNEFICAMLRDGKSMFTYETRSSSSEFCDMLMDNDIDFENLLEADKKSNGESKENSLSKTIKNSSWFFLSWQSDPTIQSMLTMLDAIHKRFVENVDFFEKLIDNENPIITFLFLNLKDFKLTDDLYIKMNSRGKALTPFENFKAKFEQYLETVKYDRAFTLKLDNIHKAVPLKQYFSHNIDTKWANLFWNYRTLQNRSKTEVDNNFDDELMNFIRVIFTNQYAINVDIVSKERDDTLEYLLGTNVARNKDGYFDVISFNKYEELKALSNDTVLYLVDAFDVLVNGQEKIKHHLTEEYKSYFNEGKSFENALKLRFDSNQERICFHAYVRFLILNDNNPEGMEQWMRVIHNLSHPENSVIDSASEVAFAIKSVENLLPYSTSILEHLKENPSIASFSTWQSFEEKIKAHLVTKNEEWKNKIQEVEKHKYFNGQIAFILEFSGIIEYYNLNNNCDWNSEENIVFFKKFVSYVDKASIVFAESYERRINDDNFIFERAVLTKGDYLTDASQWRKNLLSTNLAKNNIKRDHSWKRVLRLTNEPYWANKRMLVKQVFDDERFDVNNIENSLKSICKDHSNSWRDYFVVNPVLIKYCNQGFIRFENKDSILLYGESQSNHLHAEMYTYNLWKEYFEKNIDKFTCFKGISYYDVKSIESNACIILYDFCYSKIHYQIEIYYCSSNNLQKPYEIAFRKSKGEKKIDNYNDDVKQILNQCDFGWSEAYSGYVFNCNSENETIKKVEELQEKLMSLK